MDDQMFAPIPPVMHANAHATGLNSCHRMNLSKDPGTQCQKDILTAVNHEKEP